MAQALLHPRHAKRLQPKHALGGTSNPRRPAGILADTKLGRRKLYNHDVS